VLRDRGFWLVLLAWAFGVAWFMPPDPGILVGLCGGFAALWIRASYLARQWKLASEAWEQTHQTWRDLAKEYEEEADRWRDATHLWQSIALMDLTPKQLTGTRQ
jgi:hypothetical protein